MNMDADDKRYQGQMAYEKTEAIVSYVNVSGLSPSFSTCADEESSLDGYVFW